MFWLYRAAPPGTQPGSVIVNTASIQACDPSPALLSGAATKAAIVNFTKALLQIALKGSVRHGTGIAGPAPEVTVPEPEDDSVPIPATDSGAEHDRVRNSNDRDQQLERDGKTSRHNEGYDQAADGRMQTPEIDRVVDEP